MKRDLNDMLNPKASKLYKQRPSQKLRLMVKKSQQGQSPEETAEIQKNPFNVQFTHSVTKIEQIESKSKQEERCQKEQNMDVENAELNFLSERFSKMMMSQEDQELKQMEIKGQSGRRKFKMVNQEEVEEMVDKEIEMENQSSTNDDKSDKYRPKVRVGKHNTRKSHRKYSRKEDPLIKEVVSQMRSQAFTLEEENQSGNVMVFMSKDEYDQEQESDHLAQPLNFMNERAYRDTVEDKGSSKKQAKKMSKKAAKKIPNDYQGWDDSDPLHEQKEEIFSLRKNEQTLMQREEIYPALSDESEDDLKQFQNDKQNKVEKEKAPKRQKSAEIEISTVHKMPPNGQPIFAPESSVDPKGQDLSGILYSMVTNLNTSLGFAQQIQSNEKKKAGSKRITEEKKDQELSPYDLKMLNECKAIAERKIRIYPELQTKQQNKLLQPETQKNEAKQCMTDFLNRLSHEKEVVDKGKQYEAEQRTKQQQNKSPQTLERKGNLFMPTFKNIPEDYEPKQTKAQWAVNIDQGPTIKNKNNQKIENLNTGLGNQGFTRATEIQSNRSQNPSNQSKIQKLQTDNPFIDFRFQKRQPSSVLANQQRGENKEFVPKIPQNQQNIESSSAEPDSQNPFLIQRSQQLPKLQPICQPQPPQPHGFQPYNHFVRQQQQVHYSVQQPQNQILTSIGLQNNQEIFPAYPHDQQASDEANSPEDPEITFPEQIEAQTLEELLHDVRLNQLEHRKNLIKEVRDFSRISGVVDDFDTLFQKIADLGNIQLIFEDFQIKSSEYEQKSILATMRREQQFKSQQNFAAAERRYLPPHQLQGLKSLFEYSFNPSYGAFSSENMFIEQNMQIFRLQLSRYLSSALPYPSQFPLESIHGSETNQSAEQPQEHCNAPCEILNQLQLQQLKIEKEVQVLFFGAFEIPFQSVRKYMNIDGSVSYVYGGSDVLSQCRKYQSQQSEDLQTFLTLQEDLQEVESSIKLRNEPKTTHSEVQSEQQVGFSQDQNYDGNRILTEEQDKLRKIGKEHTVEQGSLQTHQLLKSLKLSLKGIEQQVHQMNIALDCWMT